MRNQKFHPDVENFDFKTILSALGKDDFIVFMKRLNKEINLLRKFPEENTTALK